jgi:hypothetical protein
MSERLQGVTYNLPDRELTEDERNDLAECERRIEKYRLDPKQQLEVAVEEANHMRTAQRYGLVGEYAGAEISYLEDSEGSKHWLTAFGRVEFDPEDREKLSIEEEADVAVAGLVALTIILGCDPDEATLPDYKIFTRSGRAPRSELIYQWKRAKERGIESLKNNSDEQQLIHREAAKFQLQVLGVGPSIKK